MSAVSWRTPRWLRRSADPESARRARAAGGVFVAARTDAVLPRGRGAFAHVDERNVSRAYGTSSPGRKAPRGDRGTRGRRVLVPSAARRERGGGGGADFLACARAFGRGWRRRLMRPRRWRSWVAAARSRGVSGSAGILVRVSRARRGRVRPRGRTRPAAGSGDDDETVRALFIAARHAGGDARRRARLLLGCAPFARQETECPLCRAPSPPQALVRLGNRIT